MKATDESEALAHMRASFAKKNFSGWARAWQETKTAHLTRLSKLYEINAPPRQGFNRLRVLELGVGDLTHLRGWGAFTSGSIKYTGIDFVPDVIQNAQREFPGHLWIELPFSRVRDYFGSFELLPRWDLILLLDVLCHIPSDDVYRDVLDFAFEHSSRWVMLTHTTDMRQKFDQGKVAGDAGFCWFPRPFEMPAGPAIGTFDVIDEAESPTPQRQRLIVAERV